jgi:hypothetical protein
VPTPRAHPRRSTTTPSASSWQIYLNVENGGRRRRRMGGTLGAIHRFSTALFCVASDEPAAGGVVWVGDRLVAPNASRRMTTYEPGMSTGGRRSGSARGRRRRRRRCRFPASRASRTRLGLGFRSCLRMRQLCSSHEWLCFLRHRRRLGQAGYWRRRFGLIGS